MIAATAIGVAVIGIGVAGIATVVAEDAIVIAMVRAAARAVMTGTASKPKRARHAASGQSAPIDRSAVSAPNVQTAAEIAIGRVNPHAMRSRHHATEQHSRSRRAIRSATHSAKRSGSVIVNAKSSVGVNATRSVTPQRRPAPRQQPLWRMFRRPMAPQSMDPWQAA